MLCVRPVPVHFLLWLLAIPLILAEIRAFEALQASLALHHPGIARRVQAEVTALRDEQSLNPQVRYRFQVPGDDRWYTATDLLGRTQPWIPVSRTTYEQLAATQRRIDVLYLPDTPWVNEPIGRAGQSTIAALVGWLLLLTLDAVWLFETITIVRNYVLALIAAERRELLHMRFWRTQPEI